MHIVRLLLFLGVTLVDAPVLAQPSQPTVPSPQSTAGGWITQLQPGEWQASNLEGLDVYSSNNGDKIGDIRDLIFNSNGKVQAIVIGIGGYLGLGKRDISVPFDQIRFVNKPRVKTLGATTGEARLAETNTGSDPVASPTATGTAAERASPNSPVTSNMPSNNASAPLDHAILMMSVTKDELRAAPEFRGDRSGLR